MNSFLPLVAQAAQQPSLFASMAPMLMIFLVFYVVWFMPLRKKQKALDGLLDNLKKGDRVITNGGLYGKVAKVDDLVVVLEIADNVRVRVARRAIGGLENPSSNNSSDGQADPGRK